MRGHKRSFDAFAVPLSPYMLTEWDDVRESLNDRTIRELIAAGSTVTDIEAGILDLTNKIHPVFRNSNICACKPEESARDRFALTGRQHGGASDFAIGDSLHHLRRHTAVRGRHRRLCTSASQQHTLRFRVHPRRKLNRARKAETLEPLNRFADEVRIHFKEVTSGHGGGNYIKSTTDGYAGLGPVPRQDPDHNPTKDFSETCSESATCSQAVCTCPDRDNWATYAWRNGKPAIDCNRFQHIFMNTGMIDGFDQISEEFLNLTIPKMKVVIFGRASIICHEFAHAFMMYHVGDNAFMNDEPICETGYSCESFTFGGMVDGPDLDIDPIFELKSWPNIRTFFHYTNSGAPLGSWAFDKLQAGDQNRRYMIDPWQYERFLSQSFWDEKTPDKSFMKMWMRPYNEVAIF